MKKTNLIKVLMLVLLASLAICSMAFVSGAEEEEKVPTIIGKNILYTDKTAIQIAVDPATVDTDVTLTVTSPNGKSVTYSSYVVSEDASVAGAYVFTVDGVPASAISDVFTFVVKSADKESAPFTYSVAEYFYERLYSDGIVNATEGKNASRKSFYETYIANGAAAQDLFRNYDENGNYVVTTTLVTDYTVLAVEKGTLSNGREVMLSTEALASTVTANAALAADKTFTGKWTVTTLAETETEVVIANGGEATAAAGYVTVVTPVYSDATGDFYNGTATGKRYDYDSDNATAYPIEGGKGTYVNNKVENGSLVFYRIPDTTGEGYMNFKDLNTKTDVFVFESDTRFSGFTKGTSVIKIRFQLGGIDEQITISHSGDDITFTLASGTGSVKIKENQWYNVRFELNISTRAFNIFIDNEYKGTLTSGVSTTTTSARVLYYILSGGQDGVVEFDNIYYGFVAEGTAIPQN